MDFFSHFLKGLPSTKLHTLLLDHTEVKLTWFIDWAKKEVLFNVDEAFTPETEWFSFGFSKRGKSEGSDICFFVRSFYDEAYNEAIVRRNNFHHKIVSFSFTLIYLIFQDAYIGNDRKIYKDLQQDCELLRIDERSVAFKRKFDTCDPQDFPMHVSICRVFDIYIF